MDRPDAGLSQPRPLDMESSISGSGSRSASTGSARPASPHEFLHLVSHTSQSSLGDAQDRTSPAVFDLSQDSASESGAHLDWQQWARAYAAGSWRPDTAPQPPEAISRVLDRAQQQISSFDSVLSADSHPLASGERDSAAQSPSAEALSTSPGLSMADFNVYPGSASSPSEQSSTSGRTGESDHLMSFFRRNRYLPAPKSLYEEERLRTMRRYDLQDPVRRARSAINKACTRASPALTLYSHTAVSIESVDWPRITSAPTQ